MIGSLCLEAGILQRSIVMRAVIGLSHLGAGLIRFADFTYGEVFLELNHCNPINIKFIME